MRKALGVLAVLLVLMIPIPSLAADNTIQLELPHYMEGEHVQYYQEGFATKQTQVDEGGKVSFLNLSDGIYHIVLPETEQYVFEPITVTVPYIDSKTNEKSYDLIIHPKYRIKPKESKAPETGDHAKSWAYVGVGAISLIIVAIMSCHNQFKCDRMTGKYSRRRRI